MIAIYMVNILGSYDYVFWILKFIIQLQKIV